MIVSTYRFVSKFTQRVFHFFTFLANVASIQAETSITVIICRIFLESIIRTLICVPYTAYKAQGASESICENTAVSDYLMLWFCLGLLVELLRKPLGPKIIRASKLIKKKDLIKNAQRIALSVSLEWKLGLTLATMTGSWKTHFLLPEGRQAARFRPYVHFTFFFRPYPTCLWFPN